MDELNTKKPNLLPCPLCGGEARYVESGPYHSVYCPKCKLEIIPMRSKKKVIEKWNTRTLAPNDEGRRE